VGGISDWLADGVSGWLVRPYDVGALARRLDRLVRDPDEARRLGAEGRARVLRHFSVEGHLARLLDLYADPAHG
jgi:glycosyltransferase involved in cell wall biosynthesis